MQGTVKRKNDEKGYGFIEPAVNGQDVFFHLSGLDKLLPFEELRVGDHVEYETVPGKNGKGPQAVKIRVTG